MAQERRARIVLIDDDAAFLELMRELLQEFEGYELLTCRDGHEAYAFVKEHRPDLVLLDIRMGGNETGWTILERLGRDPATRSIPLIVCSAALGDGQEHDWLLRERGVAVLPKPFDLDALLEKVEAALARARG